MGGEVRAVVRQWNDDRGFGFARVDGETRDRFLHVNEIEAGLDYLVVGQAIVGVPADDPRGGRLRAVRLADSCG